MFIYKHILLVHGTLIALLTVLAGTNPAHGTSGQSDRVSGTSELDASRPFLRSERTAFVTITNRSGYFGYELVTIIGLNRDQREYDTKFMDVRDFDSTSLFVRALVGFSDYGRPV